MAICPYCDREMHAADACTVGTVTIDGKVYDRIPYRKEEGYDMPDRCHDCLVALEQFHHPGCDMELCPVCGEQFIGCEQHAADDWPD